MTKWCSIATGVYLLLMSVACSEMTTPVSPSHIMAVSTSAEAAAASTSPTPTDRVITMLSDYTVTPSRVTVKAGSRATVVNNSGKYVQFHSYNCSQFQMVDPDPGRYTQTGIFKTAGKVCDYFAWDTNWSRKIFVGRVEVVP
jgi:hypothetical protein